MSIKIVSLNVRGLRDELKRRAIFNYYRTRANIICLQETHSECRDEKRWVAEWSGDILFAHGASNSRGVCVLLQKGMGKLVSDVKTDEAGRKIKFNILINNVMLCICNIYAPNTDNPTFFDETFKMLAHDCENRILVGDFNLVMLPSKDRIGSQFNKFEAREVIDRAMEELLLCEIWRDRNPDEKRYSWYKCRPVLRASRIDFAIISKGIADMCENTGYITGIMSDHLAFFAYFNIMTKPRGPGYWKLNNSYLRNSKYIELINQTLDGVLAECTSKTYMETWEFMKYKIRNVSRDFAKQNVSDINLIIAQLSEKVDEMEQNLQNADLNLLEKTKIDLEDFMRHKTETCIFKSKVNYAEMGEKPTKYFFNMEKARYNARTCHALYDEKNGNKLVSDTNGILTLQENFYRSLYTSDGTVDFCLENDTGITVPLAIQDMQNTPFTKEEIGLAIKQLPNDKTCGNDGIPIDFYKVFWTKLSNTYMGMIQEIYENRRMNRSALLGVINMIPKSGKNSRKLSGLRPITLLNSDYKAIEKAIANRMDPAMPHIINADQRGFMKNRRIASNIRMIFELMRFTEQNDISSFILSLDFQKCFDKIEFCALYGALEYFQFGDYVTNWTKILYSGFQVNTQNNGFFSKRISIQRGIHQGGPCSSLYFLICAELMAIMLRTDKNIKGIPVKDFINTLGQYADDADIYSLFEKKSFESIFQCLERFRAMSGFSLNYDKTSIFRIGSIRNTNAMLISQRVVSWTNDPLNILGVWISNNEDETMDLNYQPLLSKTKSLIHDWTKRSLSLHGKVLIINTLVSSLFVYRMMVLPAMSETIRKELRNLIIDFIWNGAKPKISHGILTLSKKDGGLNLCDLDIKDKALKIGWIQILYSDVKLANIVYENICPLLREKIWLCNLEKRDINDITTDKFWREVLHAWNQYKRLADNLSTVNEEILWCNSKICIGNRIIFWRDCIRMGLIYVHQLFRDNTTISIKEAKDVYHLDLMRYNSVLSALPAKWKIYFKEKQRNEKPNHYFMQATLVRHKLTSHAYKTLQHGQIELIDTLGRKVEQWETAFKIEYEEFVLSLRKIYLTTNIPKYRSFQYRLLNRALVLNTHLFRWGKRNNNLCSFCKQEPETYLHIFIYCERVAQMWIQVEELMASFEHTPIDFSIRNVICNSLVKDPKNVKNFIGLMLKQYIYRQRCLGKSLKYQEFEHLVWNMRSVERYIAEKNHNIIKFKNKWQNNRGYGHSFFD